MKRDKNPWDIYPVICLIFFGLIVNSCSKEIPIDDRLFGAWSISDKRGHVILTLEEKGKWNSDIRVEDISKKIVKKLSEAKGEWHVEENRLIMTVVEAETDSFWTQGENATYEIVWVKEFDLQLKGQDGKILEWKRLKDDKKKSDKAETVTLNLGPMVVNLFKEKPNSKERYLCINIDLILEDSNYDKHPVQIHPKIKEATIFYLSSLRYIDVNKIDKLHIIHEQIKNSLSPYIDGTIRGVIIKKIIVTSDPKTVEDFQAEYLKVKKPENEKEKESAKE